MKTRSLLLSVLLILSPLKASAEQPQASRGLTIQPIKLANERGEQVEIYRESHALVIGMSKYFAGWPPLPGVAADVQAVAAALEKQGFQVVKAVDLSHDQLDQAFRDFIANYGRDPQNRLLFYFAGHGHTLGKAWGDSLGYIVPVDAPDPRKDEGEFLRQAINMRRVDEYAREINSKHALFLFDCCFSGCVFEVTRAIPEDIGYKTAQPVRQFITSGSAGEKVPDRSVFQNQFVAALDGEGDMNKDNYITGTELGMFLQSKVINYSEGTQHPQYGKIRNPNLDKGDFVFQVSREEASLPSKPPVENAFSVDDLKLKADGLEATKQAWAGNLTEMKKNFTELESLEKRGLPSADIALAWQRFVESYGRDNPFSTEDEGLLSKARERQTYWQNHTEPRREEQNVYVPGAARDVPKLPGLRMVTIPAGTFQMGSENSRDDEKLVHEVSVSSFEMSATEITQAQYLAEMGNNPSYFKGDNLPVEQVSWYDAMEFCRRLSERMGQKYELPTEAEREYACRAGTTTKYYTGDRESDLSRAGWHDGNSGGATHPVGQQEPNAFGLYDMHGNVWEWCSDWYSPSYYGQSVNENDPQGPSSGSLRVLRGGSWYFMAYFCRSADRYYGIPGGKYYDVGFRVVRR